MTFTLDDLWGKILRCATQGKGPVSHHFGETKVCDLHMAVTIYQQILWFEISIRDVHLMQIIESKNDFSSEEQGNIVSKPSFSPQQGEQLSTACIVQEHKHMRLCLESAKQSDDEGMVDRSQDFLFAFNVLYLLKSDNFRFLQHLQSHGLTVLIVLVLDESHTSESASS